MLPLHSGRNPPDIRRGTLCNSYCPRGIHWQRGETMTTTQQVNQLAARIRAQSPSRAVQLATVSKEIAVCGDENLSTFKLVWRRLQRGDQ